MGVILSASSCVAATMSRALLFTLLMFLAARCQGQSEGSGLTEPDYTHEGSSDLLNNDDRNSNSKNFKSSPGPGSDDCCDESIATYVTFLTVFLMAVVCFFVVGVLVCLNKRQAWKNGYNNVPVCW